MDNRFATPDSHSESELTHYNIGVGLRELGRHNEAAYANFSLGQAYALLGDKTGAMQQYHILQTLNPRLAALLLQRIGK